MICHATNVVKFQCAQCELKSKSGTVLKHHITKKHETTSAGLKFQCVQCEFKCKSETVLKHHIYKNHETISAPQVVPIIWQRWTREGRGPIPFTVH